MSFHDLHQVGLSQSSIDSYFITNNTPRNLHQIELSEDLYTKLHAYILSKFKDHSKTTIGNLYKLFNPSYSSIRPDNVYRKIEKINQKNNQNLKYQKKSSAVTITNSISTSNTSNTSSCSPTQTQKINITTPPSSGHYGKHAVDKRDKRQQELRTKFKEVQHSLQRTAIDNEYKGSTILHLQNELDETKSKLQTADKKNTDLQTILDMLLEEHHLELENLAEKNRELESTIIELEEELAHTSPPTTNNEYFTMCTKDGTRYVNSIRELYYNLMSIGISPEKISTTISSVLNKLCPSIDTSSLKLPSKSCANYMRQAEMPTISNVHKATNLTNTAQQGHINSDGTTLNMRKLIGSSISGTVLGVQEVSDGRAETMLQELDKQLSKLRQTANELQIPNANSINWTLILSSTSDGAATQTKFNRLLQELRKRDENQFGPENSELKEIVTNKCGMHLGVNLRKAQNSGIQDYERTLNPQQQDPQDPQDRHELQLEDSSDQDTTGMKRDYRISSNSFRPRSVSALE